ncbi:MAG TPA: NADH-quinone oxidoreductase subunit NuoE [Chloroflexota bacterium]|nr:NADH-quinone oxidoreductase subunit NuoE [Chloroflexota bacterium]
MPVSQTPMIDLSEVDAILAQARLQHSTIIPVLQDTQEVYGYLPREALSRIAQVMEVPFSQVYGVATFYSQFYLNRRGKNIVRVCDGTACHVRGAARTLETLRSDLKIEPGDTTEDYQFTYEIVYCLGACALAPVAVVNGEVKRKCSSERMHKLVTDLKSTIAAQ